MQPVSSPNGGHGPRRFMPRLRKLGMRIRQLVLSVLWPNALAIRNSSEIMLCFVKNVLQRFMFSTLMSQRNAHAVRGRATVNDVERFRNGSLIHEFYRPISEVTSRHVISQSGGQASVCLQHGSESEYEAWDVTRLF